MLKGNHYKLLMSMFDYNRQNSQQPLIHKGDNCVQYGTKELSDKLGVSKASVQQLFRAMRDNDLMRTVIDNTGLKKYMVNPSFHVVDRSKYELWFMRAMYHTANHDDAVYWARWCRQDYALYDYKSFVLDKSTGELVLDKVRPLLHNEVKSWEDEVRGFKMIWSRDMMLDYDLYQSLKYVPTERELMEIAALNAHNPDYEQPEVATTRYQKMSIALKYIDSLKETKNEPRMGALTQFAT